MSGKNVMLETFGRFSKTNLVLLILDEMAAAAEAIWNLAGRTNRIEFFADKISFTEIVSHAQGKIYDGILLKQVELLSLAEQEHLERLLIKMQSHERGKFILTSNDFNSLHPQLQKILCKINFTFSYKPEDEKPEILLVEEKENNYEQSASRGK